MIYALVITLAAGLLLLAVPFGLYLAGSRAARGALSLRNWSWRPNALGFTVLAILGAIVLFRFFPEILFVPIFLPFILMRLRGRRSGGNSGGSTGGPFVWQWRARRPPASSNGHSNGHQKDDDQSIEGQYRKLDDE